ncbi:MAG: hypothetical protein K0Q66_2090 [Chitinophagaceae bacterium]|jgi:hypothetical protein|nr:hypothetical protein [Chitinophagaceae bacterium]
MKKTALVFGFIVVAYTGESQRADPVDSIIREGQLLYRLEMASWTGTEIFFKKYQSPDQPVGYFSYEYNHRVHCVFFYEDTAPKVLATISFDTSFSTATARADFRERNFSQYEMNVHYIRELARAEIEKDTLFNYYENTSFSLVPVVDSNTRKVYIFTAPDVKGVAIFGNDYLLQFNKADSLLDKKALHVDFIPVEFGKDTDPEAIETFHLHDQQAGKWISPTDVCTLMLYRRFSKWKQHVVISKTHVSIWDISTNQLSVITKDQWNKMNNNKKFVSN